VIEFGRDFYHPVIWTKSIHCRKRQAVLGTEWTIASSCVCAFYSFLIEEGSDKAFSGGEQTVSEKLENEHISGRDLHSQLIFPERDGT